ncbi:SGNH hydrolase-type esterase domain-containing protein [Dioscorea alata]|uniref:SGNH hydrolase-type esterase domain-containing protein n=1 Tax=Dioscorea alata TaxID=55571 RepID=A0ACB7W4N1_DIOAL|nr:SGNH hydrolase-type esterase domain-containing protein [Dioscorea alata]
MIPWQVQLQQFEDLVKQNKINENTIRQVLYAFKTEDYHNMELVLNEICKNTEEYLLWDFFHPIEHAYNLIFKAFLNAKSSFIRLMNLRSLTNILIPYSLI